MTDVFISHVAEDAPVALEIALELEERGYTTWCFEADSVPGGNYLLQTKKAIEGSQAFLLLISGTSIKAESRQVDVEVVRAHESQRLLIPVRIGVTHDKFAKAKPTWQQVLGATTSMAFRAEEAQAGLSGIVRGLEAGGIRPTGRDRSETERRARAQRLREGFGNVACTAGEPSEVIDEQPEPVLPSKGWIARLVQALGTRVQQFTATPYREPRAGSPPIDKHRSASGRGRRRLAVGLAALILIAAIAGVSPLAVQLLKSGFAASQAGPREYTSSPERYLPSLADMPEGCEKLEESRAEISGVSGVLITYANPHSMLEEAEPLFVTFMGFRCDTEANAEAVLRYAPDYVAPYVRKIAGGDAAEDIKLEPFALRGRIAGVDSVGTYSGNSAKMTVGMATYRVSNLTCIVLVFNAADEADLSKQLVDMAALVMRRLQ